MKSRANREKDNVQKEKILLGESISEFIERRQREWKKKSIEELENLWNIQKPIPYFEWFEIASEETHSYHFSEKAANAYETLRDYLKYSFLQGNGLRPNLIYSQEEYFCIDPFNFLPPKVIRDREAEFLLLNDGVLDIYECRRRNLFRLHYAEDLLITKKNHVNFKEPQLVALIYYLYDNPDTKAEDLRDLKIQRNIHPDMRYFGSTLNNVISRIRKNYLNVKVREVPTSSITSKGEVFYTLESTINKDGEAINYVAEYIKPIEPDFPHIDSLDNIFGGRDEFDDSFWI